MEKLLIILQLVAGLGIYNVWFVRSKKQTVYRGKGASNLKNEFLAYGLPVWVMYVVGTIKVVSATFLLLGIWNKAFVQPAAIVLAIMMIGAISMHFKVKDSFKRTLPSILMFSIVALIVLLA